LVLAGLLDKQVGAVKQASSPHPEGNGPAFASSSAGAMAGGGQAGRA
jgi:hypothetical protein